MSHVILTQAQFDELIAPARAAETGLVRELRAQLQQAEVERIKRTRQESILLSFVHFIATHDVGLGNGARARALQQAAFKAVRGDAHWREAFDK